MNMQDAIKKVSTEFRVPADVVSQKLSKMFSPEFFRKNGEVDLSIKSQIPGRLGSAELSVSSSQKYDFQISQLRIGGGSNYDIAVNKIRRGAASKQSYISKRSKFYGSLFDVDSGFDIR